MAEQLQAKVLNRKRKKKHLLIRLQNPNEEEIHQDIDKIETAIFKVFSTHIGKENAITSYDLFKEIYKVYPEEVDVFQRAYLWEIIKNFLMKYRSMESLFVVNNGYSFYVLKTREEASVFKGKADRMIDGLQKQKIKADRWVTEEKWRKIAWQGDEK